MAAKGQNMTLAYLLDTLDGLDDAHKALYKEADGKFTLDVSGVVPQSRFDEINQKSVDNATEAARRRKTVERITSALGVEDASGIDAALETLKKGGKGVSSEDQEAAIAALKAAHAKDLEGRDGTILELRLGGSKAEFTQAMIKAGFPAKAAEMFAAANMGRIKLDENGAARIMSDKGTPLAGSGADGFATIADLSKELAAAMPEFLVDKGKGGGGKPPASNAAEHGGDPSKMTATERAQWANENPEAAQEFYES